MPLLEKDFGVGRGLLSKNETLRAYNPSWGDKIASWLMGDSQASPERRQFVGGLLGTTGLGRTNIGALDATPVGAVLDLQRASQEGDRTGMALAAAGILPGAGVAEKVAAKVADAAAPAVKEGIIAYHGSPHSFDKFDLSKIGTGEGAQAYGHGLYFADSEDVARSYRDNLAVKNDPREGINNILDNVGFGVQRGDVEAHAAGLGLPNLSGAQLDDIYAALKGRNSDGTISDSGLDALRRLDRTLPPAGKGSMYQVRINADPNAFLDWDKPLSEQSPIVQQLYGKQAQDVSLAQRRIDEINAMRSADGNLPDDVMSEYADLLGQKVEGNPSGSSVWNALARKFGSPNDNGVEASKVLTQQGIPGIKYLDQGSRGAGEGSRNYVVFDDSLIEILRKYGLLGAIGVPSAYSTMQQFQPAPNQAPAT